MTIELAVLAWGCVLGLVHIFWAGQAKTGQYGAKWNAGPRDGELAPPRPLVGRLMRAQANFFETFPVMIAAVAIVSLADLRGEGTAAGALIWLAARVVYLPIYAAGIAYLRSVVFLIGLVGMLMVLWPALRASFAFIG